MRHLIDPLAKKLSAARITHMGVLGIQVVLTKMLTQCNSIGFLLFSFKLLTEVSAISVRAIYLF